MPNFYNVNRGNEQLRQKAAMSDYNKTSSGEVEKSRVEKSSEDLIIDDNSVYEIDPECYERARQSRMNHRQDWNKK
ncbi:hypothetical protein acsn021_31570 [Anaerocolumna cellulosilytica]|uniref:Uncharacterized protein n=1 Tax=Anaerocolumna cellulosilytica TaxID=433286 RepID=A0A6S6R9E2_9FIRM|nr:hypothetical protein [Anaerocolumna cellulosilytica]MBB5196488.1 hypothetical protein [Anaerocolumna cellulosilytica]BCJ95588.1 hypothetical protein acsn021_31570 [Anaerocolumna cellulosilytica]